ncbi:MAG: aromatic hydrocarbon degradation protein [Bacteroidales bacterium]|nr:aromatic hydrocarbon degradation protein [Bacteroidales bacterium]
MKKILLITGIALSVSIRSWAGGLLTNTNQSIHFLRNPARDASTEIDAAYTNPAGLSLLPADGFYFAVNNQSAFQTRTITSTFDAFVGSGGNKTKEFEGKASAPIIPSVQAAYKTGRWVLSGNISVAGGGGKATFNSGLPSFEAPISTLPGGVTQLGALLGQIMPGATLSADQYSVNAYMEGSSFIYGAQIGGTYAIDDRFSVYGGLRMNIVDNGYIGHLTNIQTNPSSNVPGLGSGVMIPASNYFTALAQHPDLPAQYKDQILLLAQSTADKYLDCSQSGWGVTPIIGVNFNWNKLNIGAKYEFNTHLNVENKTKVDDTGMFRDGVNTPHDIPGLLTIGAKYDIIDPLTVSVGYHHFFDSNAKMANDKQKHIDGGINEFLAGVEYKINRLFLVSCGGQITRTGVKDAYQTDLSYSLDSYSIGFGGAVNVAENVRINVAYFFTNYEDWTKHVDNYAGTGAAGTDVFARTNKTFGVGVDFSF